MLSDDDIDVLFEEFLDNPELDQWQAHLDGLEYEIAQSCFRKAVRRAIKMHGNPPTPQPAPDQPDEA
jgi:hypothetical protein